MKNNSLDDIIKCNIEISSPASSDETFDTILIVVPQPTSEGESVDSVFPISKASDLIGYGYTEDSEAYVAASVAFAQNPAPATLLVYARKTSSGQSETITQALTNALAEKNFYGIHITSFKQATEVSAACAWAETNSKLFGYEYSDIASAPIQTQTYFRSFGVFCGLADASTTPTENNYLALALMSKCFGYKPGSETWAYKELAMVVPSNLTTAQKQTLDTANVTTFLRYAGSNITLGGKTNAGEWIDVIRFRDWLKANIQTKVFNVIKVNKKVPFTDAGISMIEGAMESALKEGQEIGGIANTEYDENGLSIPGYTIIVPKASSFTESEKKSRNLTGCNWTARLAGAIHAVEISGFLTF